MKLFNNEKGFTLIEVLIVILITGILSTSLINLAAAGKNMYERNKNTDEIENDARIGMAAIVSRIRKNDKIDSSGNYYVQIVNDSNEVLADFKDESDILRVGISGSYAFITLNEDGNIIEKKDTDKELTKTGLIKSLTFTNMSDTEDFSIKIEIRYDQSGLEKTLETDVVLRSGN